MPMTVPTGTFLSSSLTPCLKSHAKTRGGKSRNTRKAGVEPDDMCVRKEQFQGQN